MTATQRSKEFYGACAAVFLWLLVVYVAPLPALLETTLDSSWQASLTEQFLRHAQCGIDLVFTYGPWGFLGEPRGNPAIYPWLAFGRLVLALGLSLGAARVACNRAGSRAVRWFWLALFVILANPAILAPFLLYAVFFESDNQPHRGLCLAALVPACALTAHIKLVALPLVAALWVLMLVRELRAGKRFPWVSASLAACYTAFYFAAGQHASSFVPYLRGALSTMSGYGMGMALDGPAVTAIAGAVLCLAMPASYLAAVWMRRDWVTLPGAAWVAAYFFMAFKQGFVRPDGGHLLAGILTFAIPASLVLLRMPPELRPIPWFRMLIALLAVETLIFVDATLESGDLPVFLRAKWTAASQFPSAFRGRAALLREYREDLAEWRAVYPVPLPPGNADILPWDVFTLLVNSVDYRPRPVPQSYGAVNPFLAGLNEAYLSGAHSPDLILFDGGVLDGRFPSTQDSLAWRALFSHYEPAGFSNVYLVLRKARQAEPIRAEKIVDTTVSWRQPVEVPAGSGAVWAEIDIPVAPLGRLIDFFFRPPEVDLAVESGGVWTPYLLVAPVARSGFLLSPVVDGPMPFALLYREARPLAPPVSRFALQTSAAGLRFFGPRIGVRLHRLSIPVRPLAPVVDASQVMLAGTVHSTAPSAPAELPPAWRVTGGRVRLEANAPSAGSLPFDGAAQALLVDFGLQMQCYDLADPHARVEFRVSYRSGDGRTDRMLLRRTVEARGDRDAASSEVLPLPTGAPGSLSFATTPLDGNCRAGAYWSGVKLR